MNRGAILIPSGPTFSISTLTTLSGSVDIRRYKSIIISLANPDVTNLINLFVDPSVSGIKFNTGRRQSAVALPGEEGSVEIQPDNNYPFIRISAQTDSPFPTVTLVTFEVRVACENDWFLDQLLRSGVGALPV